MGELHYLTYDPEAMWTQMHRTYLENGGDPLYPGDEKEMLLRGTMAILAQCYAAFDHAARMQTLRYAAGDYLDIIGEKRGIQRIRAVNATGKATVTITRGTSIYTIAAGTLMTDGARTFETLEAISIPAGSGNSIKEVSIQCTIAGKDGNGMPIGAELHLKEQDARVLSVIVSSLTVGGVDIENDEAYRDRIREGGFFGATTGPKGAYQARALTVSANIVDAGAYKKEPGVVCIALILADGLSQEEKAAIRAEVEDVLSDDATRPLTDTVVVEEAGEVSYLLNIDYQIGASTAEDVLTKLNAAVAEYQEWQDNTVGRMFDPFKLTSLLYNAGATMVKWVDGSHVDNLPVARHQIDSNERLKGIVNLTEAEV